MTVYFVVTLNTRIFLVFQLQLNICSYDFQFNTLYVYTKRPKDLKFPRNLLLPRRHTVFDHVYRYKIHSAWHSWESLVQNPEDIVPKVGLMLEWLILALLDGSLG